MNSTEEGSLEESMKGLGFESTIWKIQVVVLFLLFVLGFIGNMTVLFMLLRNRLAVSQTIRHIIINLVVADLFVVNFCILTLAIWHYTVQWLGGDFLCRFSKFMQMFSLYASTFIITVISIDRCIAVVAPMSTVDNRKYTRRMLVTAWILAVIFSIPQALIFKVDQPPHSLTDIVFYQCVTFGSYTASWQEPLYAFFTLSVNFLIPLITIIICYTIILHKLLVYGSLTNAANSRFSNGQISHESQIGYSWQQWTSSGLNQRTERLRKARTTSLWISILIVVTFIICWGPYYASMIVQSFWEDTTDGPSTIDNFIFFFGMSNSVINPVIYGAFHIMKRSKQQNTIRRPDSCRTELSTAHTAMLMNEKNHKGSRLRNFRS